MVFVSITRFYKAFPFPLSDLIHAKIKKAAKGLNLGSFDGLNQVMA